MLRRLMRAFPVASPLSCLTTLLALIVPALALARVGGGESYVGSSDDGAGDGGGDGSAELLFLLIRLAIEHPKIGVPLLIIVGVGYIVVKARGGPHARTQRALQRAEASLRTHVTGAQVEAWIARLRAQDPDFDPDQLYARVRRLFMDVQLAWFRRDLSPVRALLSDATYQRLTSQLDLLRRQGVRDAIADIQVQELALIGHTRTEAYDTVHIRVRAQMRDTDVPADFTDEQAEAAAMRATPESFIEVWTFVRRPGAKTKPGQDASQGRCPNCGAPFNGGATNTCEYCGAIVNSGQHDWVLAEITQGSEHVPPSAAIDGLDALRRADPAFSVEVLEDRASLLFWRWITAQSHLEPLELAKLAAPGFLEQETRNIEALRRQGRRRVFLECAVGGVNLRALRTEVSGRDQAHVEIRWSARMATVAEGERPAAGPGFHQRWVFTLSRKSGAKSDPTRGMATSRCPNCNAPLGDTLTPRCEYCDVELSSGERDWVLEDAMTWEAFQARMWIQRQAPQHPSSRPAVDGAQDAVLSPAERERLLATMAALAAADGVVDPREEKLLRMCADRWSVPWANVQAALAHGPGHFDHLIEKGSTEAEIFLREIVRIALVDGKVDRKERQMLEAAAHHLGVTHRLPELLRAG